MSVERWKCQQCGVAVTEYLIAQHPFDPDDKVVGCPNCKAVDSFVAACWKCDRKAGGGTPTRDHGYVWYCHLHRPEAS